MTPDDATDLPMVAIALYVETGGTVADFSILPLGTVRVRATGTTAAGIHALVLGDLAAARRAQERLNIWLAGSDDDAPLPSTEWITVFAGLQPLAARAQLDLSVSL
nr:hypothetical protein [Shimia litoralis]